MRCLRFYTVAVAALVPVVPLVGAAGCAPPEGPAITAHTLHLPLSGPCPTTAAGAEFASEVTGLQATITGPGIETPIVADGTANVSVEVPAGIDRIIALFGLVGGSPAWRGVSRPTEVKAGVETPVEILLAKVADVTCARSTSLEKRVFHTATVLDDGNVLVVGGARELVDASAVCGGCFRKEASASSSASLYNPQTGVFTAVGPLTTPRMFHTATKLKDGRVVIAGGTRTALFHAVEAGLDPFPIDPTAPLTTVEVYDPSQKAFLPAGADPGGARIFAASTTLLTGEALITGGIPARGNPRNDLENALSTTTVCGGEPLSCQVGPPLARPRAGHLAFSIDPEGVFLWGGSIDIAGNGFQIEALQVGTSAFELIEACFMEPTRNLFFAAGAQYTPTRMLAAGGILRSIDGTFEVALDGDGDGSSVFIFDLAIAREGCSSGIAAGPSGGRLNLQGRRFLASAAGLPDKQSAVVAGGFNLPADFNDIGRLVAGQLVELEPADGLDYYLEGDPLIVQPLEVGGTARTLREPRAGLTATAIGDGTILFVGGLGAEGALETAEVFADPETPSQAAGVTP